MPLDRDVETLRNIPLFAGLPTPRLKLIAYTAELVRFESGEVIVRQGDASDAVYILAEGEAEVLLTDDEGKDLSLGTMGKNTLFGEIGVLCKGRRTTTVKAKDGVMTYKISSQLFLELVRSSPEIAFG